MPGFVGGWTDSHGQYVICNVGSDLTLNAVEFGYTFVTSDQLVESASS